jgi:hypothetical protein
VGLSLTKVLLNTLTFWQATYVQPFWKEPWPPHTHQEVVLQRFLVDRESFGDIMQSELEPLINAVESHLIM